MTSFKRVASVNQSFLWSFVARFFFFFYLFCVFCSKTPSFRITSINERVSRRRDDSDQRRALSPGQTKSQVVASSQLASTCDSVWRGFGQALRALAFTCDGLGSLWSRSNSHASRRKFFTVWPPNPSQHKLSDVD